jgi:hypothetical protein
LSGLAKLSVVLEINHEFGFQKPPKTIMNTYLCHSLEEIASPQSLKGSLFINNLSKQTGFHPTTENYGYYVEDSVSYVFFLSSP